MTEYLFVYGTLRPEIAPSEVADVVNQLRTVGPASVRGCLYDLGEYPGAILDASAETMIAGEVFELPDGKVILARLDDYEGYDANDPETSLFVRIKCAAALSDGRQFESWIYVYNRWPEQMSLIADGDYAKLQTAKRKDQRSINN
jgi:gamma-glutamylcyclotransferase (GGCT)/AIG2-like uncharacterized protein YtfP